MGRPVTLLAVEDPDTGGLSSSDFTQTLDLYLVSERITGTYCIS